MLAADSFPVRVSHRHSATRLDGHLEVKRLAMLSPAEEVEVWAVSEGAPDMSDMSANRSREWMKKNEAFMKNMKMVESLAWIPGSW